MKRIAAVGFAIPALVGCSSPPPESPSPNVVLLTIDTLRADRLGCYGNPSGLTPNIDRLAESGVLFENAATVAPLTLPAHASILTGTYPLHHGVRDNGGYYLREEEVTLAELLRERGYATGAFVGAFVLDSRWGLGQGFERYFDDFDFRSFDDVSLGSVQRRGDEVLEEALRWMGGVGPRPFFSWIHFYDPHTPYEPPEPHRTRSAGAPWAPYDGEVAFVDELVGGLLAWLERNALEERTLLVLLADHGEGLLDHGELEHGFFVYDSTMKVPFIVKAPKGAERGRRVKAQVRTIDVMPTVLDWLGIAVPTPVQGVSLRPLAEGSRETLELVGYGESYYPRGHYGWSELRSLRSEAFHFIEAPRPELYDLTTDPGETRNLAEERPGAVEELRAELESTERRLSAAGVGVEPLEIDDETREKLEALGYLGGPRRLAVTEGAALADPKDKIELHQLVKAAEIAAGAGRTETALRTIERVLASDPEVVEAHRIRGDLYRALRDFDRASASYRRALSLEPGYKVATFHLALLDLQAGRAGPAEAGFRRVLELDPRDNKSHLLLARIQIARRDCGAALETLDRAIESTRDAAPFHTTKAECQVALGDLDAAEESIRAALALKADVPRAHHFLGLIRQRRGDDGAAIESYRRELALFPHDPETFLRLAALHRRQGDLASEIEVLEGAVAAAPRLAEPHILLGRAYADARQGERAEFLLRRGLSLEPSPEIAELGRRALDRLKSAR